MPYRTKKYRTFKKKRAARKIQRVYRKYRTRKSSGLAILKRINHKGVFYYREKVATTIRFTPVNPDQGAYIDPVSGDGFYCLNFSIDSLDKTQYLADVFKRYKLTGVAIKIFNTYTGGPPQQIVESVTGTSTPIPGTGGVSQDLDNWTYKPAMYRSSRQIAWKNRYIDSTNWQTWDQVSTSDAKIKAFNTPWKHYLTPRIQEKAEFLEFDGTSSDFNYTRSKKAWLPTSNPTITHKGVRLAFQNLVPANWDDTRDPAPRLSMVTTYYVTFAGQSED